MQHRILKQPEVTKVTSLSRATLYRMVKDGSFPKPVNLGKRAVGWSNLAVDQWLSEIIEQNQGV